MNCVRARCCITWCTNKRRANTVVVLPACVFQENRCVAAALCVYGPCIIDNDMCSPFNCAGVCVCVFANRRTYVLCARQAVMLNCYVRNACATIRLPAIPCPIVVVRVRAVTQCLSRNVGAGTCSGYARFWQYSWQCALYTCRPL